MINAKMISTFELLDTGLFATTGGGSIALEQLNGKGGFDTMVIIDHNNKEVDVWEISTSSDKPDWVKEAFQKNILQWKDQRLRILMPALYPKWSKRSEYYGYGMYVFGDIGDIIDKTNGKVIRQSFFEKHYQLLNDE